MKNLILILVSCFAFAQEPQKPDTSKLSEKVKETIIKIEAEKIKAETLDKKISEAEKENEQLKSKRSTLYSKLKHFFNEYFGPGEFRNNVSSNSKAVKEENRNDPVEEIEVYDGQDTIRAGWLYRLFHKNDFVIRRYKIIDNEKVYLD
ncbi:hypothetical protein SAMN05421866_3476 [Chryseobacterium oranimense]|uniref:Uncharacterized protein n=1 Tax=Chryseobacterium oranimense TaxID=421058 RepID=A0A1M5V055_9FLAO|nr:hypothetical protein [Chryseobacterium oranimense]SHH68621.1 hypothetical protein SAMN05421866_3476 [Chryseobacterium oranimense]